MYLLYEKLMLLNLLITTSKQNFSVPNAAKGDFCKIVYIFWSKPVQYSGSSCVVITQTPVIARTSAQNETYLK